MLSTKKKTLTILLLAAITVATLFFGVKLFFRTEVNADITESYSVGQTVEIPAKTLSFGGKTAAATATVVYPSGSAVNSERVTLSEAGRYSVIYRADIDGNAVKHTDYIYAYDELYSFSGEKSSAYYGLDTSDYGTGKTALNVTLVNGEKMTFNKIIDLKDAEKGFAEFYFTPSSRGTAEVQGVYFTLTDIYDESNFVRFQFKNVAYLGSEYVYLAAYVTVGFGDQIPRAYSYDAAEKVWRLRINDKFGTATTLTLYGNAEDYGGTPIRDTFCRFSLDLDTKKAYLSDSAKNNSEIIDLDNPDFFDKLWGGFTTGEVLLSVEAYNYTGQNFHINFTDVAGYDFSSATKVTDYDAPEITVNTDGYSEKALPNGAKGQSYPVFPATAFDKQTGKCDVEVRAYYGFDSDTEIELDIKDGRVATDRTGKYKFVYTATDVFGNSSEKVLNFYAEETPAEITVTAFGDYPTEIKAGQTASLPVFGASGGSGKLVLTVTADKNCAIDERDNVIVPLETGALTVTCSAKDVTGYTGEFSYVINVTQNPDAVILDKKTVPEYLFGGLITVFPEMKAHDFNTGKDVDTAVYVNGVLCENNRYTPENKGSSELAEPYTVLLEYRVGEKAVLTKTLTVLDVMNKKGPVNQFNIAGYWVTEGVTVTANTSGAAFTSDGGTTAKARFAKPIVYDGFSIGIAIPENAPFNEFTVMLTDYDEQRNRIALTVFKSDGETRLKINGKATDYVVSKGGFFSADTLNLSLENGVIKDGGSMNADISYLFSAKRVLISTEAGGVSAGSFASWTVTQICNISLTSRTTKDQIEPIVVTEGGYPIYASKGENLTIHSVIAEDVLDSYVSATVTVTTVTADGREKVLLSAADAFISHSVKIEDYGKITVRYSVKDSSDNERKPTYTINVVNLSDPVITFNGKVNKAVKLGVTLKFDKATAKDGFGNPLTLRYAVVKPSLDPVLLGDDMTFTPTWEGTYIFRIFAMDEYGNIGISDYSFKVVK